MSFGSTRIGGAKYGNIPVYTSGPASTDIPYIRGGADGSYIDTGITAGNTIKVVIWARNINHSGSYEWFLGSRVNGSYSGLTFSAPGGAQTGILQIQFAGTSKQSKDALRYAGGYHKFEISSARLLVDDNVIISGTSTTFSNTLNIHLFGVNNNGNHIAAGTSLDICACKIYKKDVLVRDYTAVNSPSVGLYDAVSQTLFTNAGSGSLTYGEFDKNAYTPLEYIECAGQSYFNTGLLGTYSLPIVTKFSPNGSNSLYFLLGARTSGSSGLLTYRIGDTTIGNKNFSFGYDTSDHLLYNNASQTGESLIWAKANNVSRLYKNGTQLGNAGTGSTSSSFTTAYPLFLGALNNAGSGMAGFVGKIHYAGFGKAANYVPAKQGTQVGMYDTYNDMFHASATDTPFIAGPTI